MSFKFWFRHAYFEADNKMDNGINSSLLTIDYSLTFFHRYFLTTINVNNTIHPPLTMHVTIDFSPVILVRWYLVDTHNAVHCVHLAQANVIILRLFTLAKKSLTQATRSSNRAGCSISRPSSPSPSSCCRSSGWPSCWSRLTVSIICQINWFIGFSSRSSSRAASDSGQCCHPLRRRRKRCCWQDLSR